MDILKIKLQDSKRLIELFNEYLDRLAPILIDENEDELAAIQNIIKSYPEMYDKINSLYTRLKKQELGTTTTSNTVVEDIFILYNELQFFYTIMNNLIDYLNQPHVNPEHINASQLSQTYKLETADYLNKLRMQYTQFIKKYLTHDIDLITALVQIIISKIDEGNKLTEKLADMQKIFHKNKYTIALYTAVCNYLLHNDKYRAIHSGILRQLEQDKDFYLNTNIKPSYKEIDNPPIKRFNLLPATSTMSVVKLLSIISNNQQKGESSFLAYGKKHNLGFIVLSSITYNPIEYNILKLIDKDAAKAYMQNPDFGVNKTIIERFNTIKQTESKIKWLFRCEIIKNDKANNTDKYHVVETLDGVTYRLLQYMGNTSKSGNTTSKFAPLDKTIVQPMLNYYANRNTVDRITNYQQLCVKESIGNMFLRAPLSISMIEEHAKDVPMLIIRTDLSMKLINIIRKIINEEYDGGSKITSNIVINDIIHDPLLKTTFNETLLSMLNIATKLAYNSTYLDGYFPFYEVLSTYFANMRYLTDRFMKELHDGYNRNPLPPDTFKRPSMELNSIIFTKLEEILNKVIFMILNDKDNIYTIINYKNLLLNF